MFVKEQTNLKYLTFLFYQMKKKKKERVYKKKKKYSSLFDSGRNIIPPFFHLIISLFKFYSIRTFLTLGELLKLCKKMYILQLASKLKH